MSTTATKTTPGVNEEGIEAYHANDGVMLESEKIDEREAHEVFQKSAEGVDFRTVSWYATREVDGIQHEMAMAFFI